MPTASLPFLLLCSGMGGAARSRNRPVQGDDQRYDLRLEFTEAIFGCRLVHWLGALWPRAPAAELHFCHLIASFTSRNLTDRTCPSLQLSCCIPPLSACSKEIEVSRLEDCSTCSGSGVKAGTTSSTCATCKGAGQVVQAVRTPLGMFQQVATCPTCSGTGEQFTPCGTCQGDGRVR